MKFPAKKQHFKIQFWQSENWNTIWKIMTIQTRLLFWFENSNGTLSVIFRHCVIFFLLWVLLLSIIRRICLMHTRTCNEKNLAWFYSATHFKCNCCCCAVKVCVFLDKNKTEICLQNNKLNFYNSKVWALISTSEVVWGQLTSLWKIDFFVTKSIAF